MEATGGNQAVENDPNDILPPPGTDMTRVFFRDQLWLNSYPLNCILVFDYFALSPFYDVMCNNELLRSQSVHPLDISHLSKMTGSEYVLTRVMEPDLFVLRKQMRHGPESVTLQLMYYVLHGSIYQAPQLCNVFYSRIGRTLYHLSQGLNTVASKLEKINCADSEEESIGEELKNVKEPIDLREINRVNDILTWTLRKLPPAPPPPPEFAQGRRPSLTLKAKERFITISLVGHRGGKINFHLVLQSPC